MHVIMAPHSSLFHCCWRATAFKVHYCQNSCWSCWR